MKLIYQMLIAAFLGVIMGSLFDQQAVYLQSLGNVYINLIKTIALPLIFFSLISGMTSLSDTKSLYKIGSSSIAAFIVTGLVASSIGIMASFLLYPSSIALPIQNVLSSPSSFSFETFIQLLIPSNFLGAFIHDSSLQITLLAIFISLATLSLPQTEKTQLISLISSIQKLLFNMIEKIIALSPISVFIFSAYLVSHFERNLFILFKNYLLTLAIAYFAQYLLLGLYIKFMTGLPFFPFFRKSLEYQLIALSTGSSKVTLPYTIQVANQKLGISHNRASFVLPLGATINMDGLSIYLAVTILFVAQIAGLTFVAQDYVYLAFIAAAVAIGTAGIPGGAITILPLLFSIWQLPQDYLPLFIAIDPLINMFRTSLNITGDVAVTLILDKVQGNLQEDIYLSRG